MEQPSAARFQIVRLPWRKVSRYCLTAAFIDRVEYSGVPGERPGLRFFGEKDLLSIRASPSFSLGPYFCRVMIGVHDILNFGEMQNR